jgi:serine protease Do
MSFPRLPDWLIYLAVVLALVIAAVGRRENVDAPPPPPVSAGEAEALSLGLTVPGQVSLPKTLDPELTSTAFSVADNGVWLTARRAVEHCGRVVLVVSEGLGVAASVRVVPDGEIAVLTTAGGAPALPLADAAPNKTGELVYHLGYPQGRAGEAASRYLGQTEIRVLNRKVPAQSVLSWAEVGRTEGLKGPLTSLLGAPTLDIGGRVIGVTLSEAPRRGRVYTTTPQGLAAALAFAKVTPGTNGLAAFTVGEPITVDNYGRMADTLRRDMRVVPVVCLAR